MTNNTVKNSFMDTLAGGVAGPERKCGEENGEKEEIQTVSFENETISYGIHWVYILFPP